MSKTESTMLPLGTAAPRFELEGCDGHTYTLEQFGNAPVLLVIFMCNHCPYVKHVRQGLLELVNEYLEKGVAVVGINSNDAQAYPDDDVEQMKNEAWEYAYRFPYLVDASQEVARAYHAACTPDFFVFDGERRLAYRGQMDGSRPGNGVPVTGNDLRAALDATLAGLPVPVIQKPSLGCNIKWKPGNEPVWFSAVPT